MTSATSEIRTNGSPAVGPAFCNWMSLKVEEADSMVWDMCQLERWRVMVQEKAADQLYQPIPTRSNKPGD